MAFNDKKCYHSIHPKNFPFFLLITVYVFLVSRLLLIGYSAVENRFEAEVETNYLKSYLRYNYPLTKCYSKILLKREEELIIYQ